MRGASPCLHRRRAKSRVAKVSGHLPRDVDLELRVLEFPGQFHHISGLPKRRTCAALGDPQLWERREQSVARRKLIGKHFQPYHLHLFRWLVRVRC